MTIQLIEATPDHARQLTDRIRIAVEGTWMLIVEAYQSRAWSALGYSSWDDYCTREFGTSRIKLPREDRAERVASLRESGLSLRAISSATGIAVNTIRKDVSDVYQNDTRKPDAPAENVNLETGEIPTPAIQGMDGKTYTRPEPKPEPERDVAKELDVINDIRLYFNAIASSRQVVGLTPKGKQHIIDAANNLITELQRNQ